MTDFKFNFLNGYYLVSQNEDNKSKHSSLEVLIRVQAQLRSVLPHREREIDSFILTCVNDVLNSVSKD